MLKRFKVFQIITNECKTNLNKISINRSNYYKMGKTNLTLGLKILFRILKKAFSLLSE
jgi:hypothetical protein